MLTINITWEYFLAIFGTLIALAYYANGRLTRIETSSEWLADTVRDLSIRVENVSTRAFDLNSPISLTSTGEQLLRDSGLKSYLETFCRRGEYPLTAGYRTACCGSPAASL
jgi:hypothetical protein